MMTSGLTDLTISSKASTYHINRLTSSAWIDLKRYNISTHPETTNNGEFKFTSKLLLHVCPFGLRSHGPDHRITSIDEDLYNPRRDETIRTGYKDFGWRFERA